LRSLIGQKTEQRADLDWRADELLKYERELTQADRNILLANENLQLLHQKLEEARMIDELHAKRISNIHVFQPATYAERAVSPKKPILATGFVLLALTGGIGLAFLHQSTSPFLRTNEDIEARLGARVVSNIPHLRRMEPVGLGKQNVYRDKCQALIGEILLSQKHNGLGRNGQSRGRSAAIIGADLGGGASTLAAHLALSSSVDCRLKTVLVDADSRLRTVSKMFELNGKPGLAELVNGSASHDECLQRAKNAPVDLIAPSLDECDDVINTGAIEIVQALQAYVHNCDLLIVDLPAASHPGQAVALAKHLDCVVVVFESEKTTMEAADRLLRRLSESDTEVIGVVLNKTRSYLPTWIRRFVAGQI
jgi:Mrp family chromosome partitioning ATPase